MKFHVGLMGASLHTANRGVSALGASLATLVWRSHPGAAVSLFIGNRDASSAEVSVNGTIRTVHTITYRLSPRASLVEQLWWIVLMSAVYRVIPSAAVRKWLARTTPWIHSVVEADFLGDIRGGDSFSDIYGLKNFLLDCLPVMSVIWIRGGIHLLPQTYGPFRSRLAQLMARRILLRAESIWCRDRVSLDEVSRLTRGRRTGAVCPDVAFALQAIRPESPAVDAPLPADNSETLIGVNVSGLMYYGGYTRANMFGLTLDYREFVKQLVEQLLLSKSNRILLVPHTFAMEGRVESDPAACRDLKRRLSPLLRDRVHIVIKEYDQHEIKGVIGMSDFFVGSRMHACIAALSQGIPTVGVAYSRKFAGVFETVGAGDWVIDGRTASVQEAIRVVAELFDQRNANAPILRARIATAKTTLSRTFERIVGGQTPAGSGHDDAVPCSEGVGS